MLIIKSISFLNPVSPSKISKLCSFQELKHCNLRIIGKNSNIRSISLWDVECVPQPYCRDPQCLYTKSELYPWDLQSCHNNQSPPHIFLKCFLHVPNCWIYSRHVNSYAFLNSAIFTWSREMNTPINCKICFSNLSIPFLTISLSLEVGFVVGDPLSELNSSLIWGEQSLKSKVLGLVFIGVVTSSFPWS